MSLILDLNDMQRHGEAAFASLRERLINGRPEVAEYFEPQWNLLTRLSWAAADRVVRTSCSYPVLGLDAATHLVLLLRSRAVNISHLDRWLERHQATLCSFGASMAEHVDRALDFPLGMLVDVDVDRRGRLIQTKSALREPVPDSLRPHKAKRKPRALVPDELVTERALDAIAQTLLPNQMRGNDRQ